MRFEWPIDRTLLDPLPDVPPVGPDVTQEEHDAAQADYDAALIRQNACEDAAIGVLWEFSAKRFGLRLTRVRPCPSPPRWHPLYTGDLASPFVPVVSGGRLSCGCVGGCLKAGPRTVHLPGPVASVEEVKIASTVLDPDGYKLEGDVLYRVGANWPVQDYNRPLGEDRTWSVTYRRGTPVPAIGAQLAAILTKEFVKACSGKQCRIPKRVVSTSARGVTHVFDPSKMMAARSTGIEEVDLWVLSVNPNRLSEAPSVV